MNRRQAFTLIEILVSIGIFVVAATLMLTALAGATELFRRGETARQAGDEAATVIAALQEDVSRATPVRIRDGKPAPEWGHLVASVDGAGNCRLQMTIENADRSQMRWVPNGTDRVFVGVRKRVVWRVDEQGTGDDPTDDALVREEYDLGDNGAVIGGALRTDVMTRGCLHFGVFLELAQAHRLLSAGTAGPAIDWVSAQPPYPGAVFDSRQLLQAFDANGNAAGAPFWPQADAIRISLVLTGGGRYVTRGFTVGDLDGSATEARITGIKALSTIMGSQLRIGREWVSYADFRDGRLTGLVRGDLRSSATGHGSRTPVFAGQAFSLVVELPR